eukprot:9103893-Alexandrium_andersonii.AAC.1
MRARVLQDAHAQAVVALVACASRAAFTLSTCAPKVDGCAAFARLRTFLRPHSPMQKMHTRVRRAGHT